MSAIGSSMSPEAYKQAYEKLKMNKYQVLEQIADMRSQGFYQENLKSITDNALCSYRTDKLFLLLEAPETPFKSEKILMECIREKLEKHELQLVFGMASLSILALHRLIEAHPKEISKLKAFVELLRREQASKDSIMKAFFLMPEATQLQINETITGNSNHLSLKAFLESGDRGAIIQILSFKLISVINKTGLTKIVEEVGY